MSEYQPLHLEPRCNIDPAWVGGDVSLPTGPTLLHGLPFLLGATKGGESRGLGFGSGGYREPVEIPIERAAHWVVFAHRQLESQLLEGEPSGHCVAVYRFRYRDGGEEAVSIRERFEIGTIPVLRWGLWPILAVPDQHDRLPPRWEGPWEHAGGRLTDVRYTPPDHFYLWAWQNPQPERPLASVVIEPQDRAFLVGGVTLSAQEEDPLGREARLPVKLTLLDAARADQPFGLKVSVDRGVATYPYPLPDTEELLSDPLPGWGQEYHDANSPAYVEIAAQPSATIEVKQQEETLASVRWGDVLGQGAVETDQARVEVIDSGKNWVRVSVVDEETGQPIPCRVHFRSPEGVPYQPHGHHDHLLSDMGTWHMDVGGDLRLGHAIYAYIDGRCEGWLPRDRVLVDAARTRCLRTWRSDGTGPTSTSRPMKSSATTHGAATCELAGPSSAGGPMLHFQVEGAMVGDTLQLPDRGGTVEVQAEAESIFPIHTLQIVQDGQVVAQTDEPRGARRLQLETALPVSRHTWLAARVAGPGYTETLRHHDSWQAGVMAHTSPIYVAVGEPWWMFSQETAQYMLTLVHGSLQFVRQRSRQYVPGTVTHLHGEEDHLAYLERPFNEAVEAIHRRMHEHGLDHHH